MNLIKLTIQRAGDPKPLVWLFDQDGMEAQHAENFIEDNEDLFVGKPVWDADYVSDLTEFAEWARHER